MLGFSGLGIITSYFSDTFISSYTCASAIHVINSQIKDLFGIPNTTKFNGILNVPRVRFIIQSNKKVKKVLIIFLNIASLVNL